MSIKNFLKKLLRYVLCLAAGLLAFAACGYTDYRLWPLDLPASSHPRGVTRCNTCSTTSPAPSQTRRPV